MQDIQDPQLPGSRVYWVDTECYIIYVGKADRQYRPFLRLGTSPFLPRSIRRHIGSVILSDRLTGDLFLEADCLEKPVSHNMHYVGAPDLISAVKHFIHNDNIDGIPLSKNQQIEPKHGANVVFYHDGNLKIFLEGHEIFDLFVHEKTDKHGIDKIQRIQNLIDSTPGAYTSNELRGSGWIVLKNGSIVLLQDGVCEAQGFNQSTVYECGLAMLRPSYIRSFSGDCEREQVFTQCKWLRINREPVRFVFPPESPDESQEWDFIQLLKQSQLKVEIQEIHDQLPTMPLPADYSYQSSFALNKGKPLQAQGKFFLPTGSTWFYDFEPSLIKGLPYFYDSNITDTLEIKLEPTFKNLERMMGEGPRQVLAKFSENDPILRKKIIKELLSDPKLDGPTGLGILLWAWNRINIGDPVDGFSEMNTHLESLVQRFPLPIVGKLFQENDRWKVLYILADHASRQTISNWQLTCEKIKSVIIKEGNTPIFEKERIRLNNALATLLELNKVATKAEEDAARLLDESEQSEPIGGAVLKEPADKDFEKRGSEISGPVEQPLKSKNSTNNKKPDQREKKSRSVPRLLILLLICVILFTGLFFTLPGLFRNNNFSWLPNFMSEPLGSLGIAVNDEVSPSDQDDSSRQTVQNRVPASQETGSTETNEMNGERDVNVPEDGKETVVTHTSNENREVEEESETVQAETPQTDYTVVQEPISRMNELQNLDANQVNWLNQENGSKWSVLEILIITNWIAYNNGYAILGAEGLNGRDPNWIYPGNTLLLPGESRYLIKTGDILWNIAIGLLNNLYSENELPLEQFKERLLILTFSDPISKSLFD